MDRLQQLYFLSFQQATNRTDATCSGAVNLNILELERMQIIYCYNISFYIWIIYLELHLFIFSQYRINLVYIQPKILIYNKLRRDFFLNSIWITSINSSVPSIFINYVQVHNLKMVNEHFSRWSFTKLILKIT